MHLSGLDLLFWAAGLGAHVALLSVLLIRLRFRKFPIFTAFIFMNVARTLTLYFVERHGTKANYFLTYWCMAILDTVLQLAVVFEMYAHTFRPRGEWARDLRGSLGWLAAAGSVCAVGLTWLATPHTRLWMQAVVIKGSFFSSALMSEFFVGMIALSVRSGLPWKTHVARISQGLGVYSIIDVLIEAGHSYLGVDRNTQMYTALSHLRMTAYLCCVAYWIVSLWKNATPARRLPESLRKQLIVLQGNLDADLDRVRSGRRSW